jgi:hypothetical protein
VAKTGILEAVLIVGGLGVAFMYFSKNFCDFGLFPVEGLCYNDIGIDPERSSCDDLCVGGLCGSFERRGCKGECPCQTGGRGPVGGQVKKPISGGGLPKPGAVVTGGSSCSGRGSGSCPVCSNCNWDCKNAYCWTGTGPKVNRVCIQGNKDRHSSCSYARQKFLNANKTSGGGAAPKPSLTGVQINNGKLFIASAIYTYVKSCAGRSPTPLQIVRGYPSAITSMAQMNGYHQTKIMAYNHRPFAHLFWSVVTAIMRAYKLTSNQNCIQRTACMNSNSLKECGVL